MTAPLANLCIFNPYVIFFDDLFEFAIPQGSIFATLLCCQYYGDFFTVSFLIVICYHVF